MRYNFIETKQGGVRMLAGESISNFAATLPPQELPDFKSQLSEFRNLILKKGNIRESEKDKELFKKAVSFLDDSTKRAAGEMAKFWGQSVALRHINPDATIGEGMYTVNRLVVLDARGRRVTADFSSAYTVNVEVDDGFIPLTKILAVNRSEIKY